MPKGRILAAQRQGIVPKPRVITEAEEARIQKAKLDYEAQRYPSIRKAAIAHNVKYDTLRRRIQGLTAPCKEAPGKQQLLTKAEEGTLVDWIRYLALTGHPLNKRTIRPKVQAILLAKGIKNAGRGCGLDPKRAQAFNYTTVHAHFLLVKETIEENNIPWRNVYNMDEKGIQMGGGRKGTRTKYFFAADDKMKYKLQSDDLQLVTVIETICADGTAEIGPGFVFPGTTKHREWFEEQDITYTIGTSENGWTDDEVGFEWFKEVFVAQATERNCCATEQEQADNKKDADEEEATVDETLKLPPILLIYDGHGSHTTLDWITLARANNIILYCLPPHTTHRLQPLDVGCFGPLQIAWFNRCDEILDETGEPMEMKDVVREYFMARRKAFKSKNIFQAWKKSGLRPLNSDIFTASDFAPSHSSSTNCHAPQTFPSRMPHVSDASSDDGFFDPADFQHVVDDNDAMVVETLSDSDDDDNNFFQQSGSGSDSSSEDGSDNWVDFADAPTAGIQDASANLSDSNDDLDSSGDEEAIEDTPLARHVRPQIPASSQSRMPLLHLSTPVNQLQATTSPRHYTRSKHDEDRVRISQTPSFASSTPIPNPVEARDAYIRKLQKELSYTRAQRDAAETHAIQAQCESAVWKHRFNKKKEKSTKETSRRIHTHAQIVTNNQGLEDAQADQAKRLDKKHKEAAKSAQKAAKQKEDLVRRATQGSTRQFTGSLGLSKSKTELEDIADALKIEISGTKAILLEHINNYFNEHPRFKEDERFCGLFERTRGRKRAAPNREDENTNPIAAAAPPMQRRRLSPSSRLNMNMGTVTNTYLTPLAYPPHFVYPSITPGSFSVSTASSSRVT